MNVPRIAFVLAVGLGLAEPGPARAQVPGCADSFGRSHRQYKCVGYVGAIDLEEGVARVRFYNAPGQAFGVGAEIGDVRLAVAWPATGTANLFFLDALRDAMARGALVELVASAQRTGVRLVVHPGSFAPAQFATPLR